LIEVLNSLGQIVYAEKLSVINGEMKNEISLDQTLPGGMYLVRMTMNEMVYLRQLVLQQ